ncbi:helix-turn-helix domain-containing protein [Candidatus Oscillochloris fontis]|uniref:AlbA family DNA-binding domain-containing protein n=1 Tax=Candidatus Oscillochloris fontis TaxID=2496868 RepID=UPI00101C9434|nr:ATP-binding protein [Candidatus Oscillochloris fontis]
MSNDSDARSVVIIEETYTYDIEVGDVTIITFTSATGQVTVTVPYDGRILANETPGNPVPLGEIRLSIPPHDTHQSTQRIDLPVGTDLTKRLRNSSETVWEWNYTPPTPRDTLLATDGTVFDGAAIDPSVNSEYLTHLLFDNNDAFINDLRLKLSLWVPQLNESLFMSAPGEELRRMLLEQESDIQIFIDSDQHESLLAESMTALANGTGGRILIGVNSSGSVIGLKDEDEHKRLEQLQYRLLQAALRCNPPVVFAQPDLLKNEQGIIVARVTILPSQVGSHTVDGKFFVRRRSTTVNEPLPKKTPSALPLQPIGDIRGLITMGSTSDVIILGSEKGEVTKDDLGRALVSLVNAEVGQGLIVVRHLDSPQSGLSKFANQHTNQSFDERLRQALTDVVPQIFNPQPEFATVDGERIVILRIKGHPLTVATYKKVAYKWNGTLMITMDQSELYRRYMLRSGQYVHDGISRDLVVLLYGDLQWGRHPLSMPNKHSFPLFDHQTRAMVWRNVPFIKREGSDADICELITPLRQAFAEVHDPNTKNDNILSGVFQIKINNMLASGLQCEVKPQHPILDRVPIYKSTRIIARMKVLAGELFTRRRRASLLHFQVPDVSLGFEFRERIADIQQACADLGFQKIKVISSLSEMDVSHLTINKPVFFQGIRSNDHQDIYLILGFQYFTHSISRELQFERHTDTKQINAGHLDVRIVMSGMNHGTGSEMARLQVELSQLIQERLHFLRTE